MLQVIYLEVELMAKKYGIKIDVLFGNALGKTLRTWGTF
jgi:hypothetical protein